VVLPSAMALATNKNGHVRTCPRTVSTKKSLVKRRKNKGCYTQKSALNRVEYLLVF